MKKAVIAGIAVLLVCAGAAAEGMWIINQKNHVTAKVVPVKNINVGQLGFIDEGMFGNITSRVEQNVTLDTSGKVAEIFVKVGDHVDEGTPLFRYDTAQAELQLEIARLNQRTAELHLQRMESELKKLGGTTTAKLVPTKTELHTSAVGEASAKMQVLKLSAEAPVALSEETAAENPAGPTTEAPAAPTTEAPAEPPTEAPTEPATEAPTEPPTEAPTEPATEAPAEPPSEESTEPATEAPTEPPSEEPTEPATEAPSEPSTERPAETEADSEKESETEDKSEADQLPDAETLKNLEAYRSLAEAVLNAADASAEQTRKDSERAIEIYQTQLADAQSAGNPGEGQGAADGVKMESYRLKQKIVLYFQKQNRTGEAEKLAESYREICLRSVLYPALKVNPETVTKEELKRLMDAYDRLGEGWQRETELRWFEYRNDQSTSGQTAPTLQDTLKAYDVMISIRELDPTAFEENLISYLTALRDYYLALPEEARALVSNSEEFIEFLKQYGLWEEEQENSDGGFSDWGTPDSDYTPEERRERIKDKEREITAQKLTIKEAELEVKKQQEALEEKVVKSSISGTVLSIGTTQENSDEEYFARISSAEGLYAQGLLDEFSKQSVKPGYTITGTSLDNGAEFTAVIKEISQYPNSGNEGNFIVFGDGNQNTSYYAFYALIEDAGELPEGMAQLQLPDSSRGDVISLEQYFVRTEKNGTKYVLKRREDDRLCKQPVKTGDTNGSFVEILDGLTPDDWIAFPYGKSAAEGVETVEADAL